MGKDKRILRRKRRKERNAQIDKLIKLARETDFKAPKDRPGFLNKFADIWPFLSEALDFIKRVTREKGDKAIDEIIEIGNRVATGQATSQEQSKFFQKFSLAWKPVRVGLNIIALISKKPKVDDVIDDIIYIGDVISGFDNGEEG